MSPSPLWYTTRGAGIVLLLCLTGVVVLGILARQGWQSGRAPRFVTNGLHRNLALISVILLPIHAFAAMLDPFANLGLADITVPFVSSYRPLWLGMGVLAGELILVLVATSLLRDRIGLGLWRWIHWLAYIAWPLAVLHGLGTGSDTKQLWALLITAGCLMAVVLAIAQRLALPSTPEFARWIFGPALVFGAAILVIWTLAYPLQPGWAAAAGTPPQILNQISASPTPLPT